MRRVHALVSCQDRSSSCTAQAWQRSSRAPVACATVQRQHVRVASGWHLGAGTFANASRVSVHCKHTHAAAASVAEDDDGEEPVLTLAEAMAREEAAEAEAAVASLNDRRDEWEPCVDNATGATYYVHYQTGESSWEKPTAAN
mmetsp:Transcript_15221/g.47116  ORF Transcript_15221/g.47116 Transcript_15221/m.47116 type:complete len:143 (+) Transcript_15221:214-642(+)